MDFNHYSKWRSWPILTVVFTSGIGMVWQPAFAGLMLDQPVGSKKAAPSQGTKPPIGVTSHDLAKGEVASSRKVKPNAAQEEHVLPPLPEADTPTLAAADTFTVQAIHVTGSTVFSAEKLREMTAPYMGPLISLAKLYELREKLTRLYVDSGYATSGAVIPEQDVTNGQVTIQIVEGKLGDITVIGNKHLSAAFIKDRLLLAYSNPLNIHKVEERLQIFRQQPMIAAVISEVRPGVALGQAVLNVQVKEASPFKVDVSFHNQNAPSIGAEKGEVELTYRSLLGRSDAITGRIGKSEGATDYAVSYSIPVTPRDTTLSFGVIKNTTNVVVEPFEALNIESKNTNWSVSLRHPFYRSVTDEWAASLMWQHRVSQTYLLDKPFSFAAGPDEGKTKINSLYIGQEWSHRDALQVLAASSTFDWGVNVGDVTDHAEAPDGQFLAWLGQFQWVRHLQFLDSQAIVRVAVRLADEPMLPTEKFTIGGANTVRGYRENLLSRDQGGVGTLEWQVPTPLRLAVPVISETDSDGIVSLAAFVDYGKNWNKGVDSMDPEDLSSVGLGILWAINRNSNAVLYWGQPLRNIPQPADQDLQDHGIHFKLNLASY